MTSTPLRRIQKLCNDRADSYRESEDQYALVLAMAFEHIAIYCEEELKNEKQMIIDICNECAQEISRGNIGLGKPVGELRQYASLRYVTATALSQAKTCSS
jgi:hypothetical protein